MTDKFLSQRSFPLKLIRENLYSGDATHDPAQGRGHTSNHCSLHHSFFGFPSAFPMHDHFRVVSRLAFNHPKHIIRHVQTIAYNISSTSALTRSHRFTDLGMFSSHSPGCCPQSQDSSSRLTGLFLLKRCPGVDKTFTVVTPRMTPHKAIVIHRTTVTYISLLQVSQRITIAQSFPGGLMPCTKYPKTYYPTNVQTIACDISSTSYLTTRLHRLTGLGTFTSQSPGCCPQPSG